MPRPSQKQQRAHPRGDQVSQISEAVFRITETLDVGKVLQTVVEEARRITGAEYGAITTFQESGEVEDLALSGLSQEYRQQLWEIPNGKRLFVLLNRIQEPLRMRDLAERARSLGISGDGVLVMSFLGVPLWHQDRRIANIYLGGKQGSPEFSQEDEDGLVLFASHAAVAIANARSHRQEQRARAQLEALMDSSPIGVLMFDAKTGHLTYVNEETRRIVGGMQGRGHSLDALLSNLAFQSLDGRELLLNELPLAAALRTGDTVRAEEIVISHPECGPVLTLVNARPIYSESGEIGSVLCTIQDMTPLEEAERRRVEFFGDVGSGLGTLLAAIKGCTATMLGSPHSADPSEMLRFFGLIDEQADLMRHLINELIDVARIEMGELSISPDPVEMSDIVGQAKQAFENSGAENTIVVRLPKRLPLVEADRGRMIQALSVLFTNASHLSPEDSTIRVTASQAGSEVTVTIANEGEGIPEEQLRHLFSKYHRTDAGPGSSRMEGTGLALAICRGIVEAHGGHIWAESDGPGLGVRFVFTLPIVSVVGDTTQLPTRSWQPARERATVLAVDRDPRALTCVQSALSEAGYVPLATGNLKEAERLIERQKLQLVLMEAGILSRKDGLALMRRISENAETPIMLISSPESNNETALGLELGASDYIVKPFSSDELASRVRNTLLRRAVSGLTRNPETYTAGDLTIDYAERTVTVAGRPVQLTSTEYNLLSELSMNAGRVLSQEHLLRRVWGQSGPDESDVLRTYIMYLRKKLGDNARRPTYIFTKTGVGYSMASPLATKQAEPSSEL